MGKRIDLTGQRFGRLTVVKDVPIKSETTKRTTYYWECKCDCGKTIRVKASGLRSGHVKSCGCLFSERMKNFQDLTGMRFGRLIALKRVGRDAKAPLWECRCDCGNVAVVNARLLRYQKTMSCGCLRDDNRHTNTKTHGLSGTRLMGVWNGMIRRCENKNSSSYKNYGGRGIKVCEEWHDPEKFAEWALSNGYSFEKNRKEQSLDRIDVNGNYEPSNCHFATMKEQNNNRQYHRLVTYNDETHNLSEWAAITGIDRKCLDYRISNGWPLDDAFNITPVSGNNQKTRTGVLT